MKRECDKGKQGSKFPGKNVGKCVIVCVHVWVCHSRMIFNFELLVAFFADIEKN